MILRLSQASDTLVAISRKTVEKWIPWTTSGHTIDIAFLEQSRLQDSWIPHKLGAGDILAFLNILPHCFRVLQANEVVSTSNLVPMSFGIRTRVSLEMCSVQNKCRRQPDTQQQLYTLYLAVQQ